MQGVKRRIVQAVSYELILLGLFTPIAALIFHKDIYTTASLGVLLALIALGWNIIFNYLFERLEASQGVHRRTLKHRIYHAFGFEGGLMVMTLPLFAWLMDLTIWQALVADIGMTILVVIYTFIFQWVFDRLFGEPERSF